MRLATCRARRRSGRGRARRVRSTRAHLHCYALALKRGNNVSGTRVRDRRPRPRLTAACARVRARDAASRSLSIVLGVCATGDTPDRAPYVRAQTSRPRITDLRMPKGSIASRARARWSPGDLKTLEVARKLKEDRVDAVPVRSSPLAPAPISRASSRRRTTIGEESTSGSPPPSARRLSKQNDPRLSS